MVGDMITNPLLRLIGDEVRRVLELIEVGAPGLRRDEVGIAHAMLAPEPLRKLGMFALQPAQPVTEALVGVAVAEDDLLETVIRQGQAVSRIGPARLQLLAVRRVVDRAATRLGEGAGPLRAGRDSGVLSSGGASSMFCRWLLPTSAVR